MKPLARLLVMLSLAWAAGGAGAWGRDGHRLVAGLALERLQPAARAEVERLLALEPGSTLQSVSTWPDEVRSPTTASWHYVNFRREQGCEYLESLCPGGACVVAAIERQAAVLASDAPDTERLKALKYLVHFIADLHQPLHAGFLEDRGGNLHQVQAFGRGTNLHAVWDVALVEQWPGGLEALAQEVRASLKEQEGREPATWAVESCRIVATPGFYGSSRRLDDEYQKTWSPTVVSQLARAAERLAAVLDRVLGKS